MAKLPAYIKVEWAKGQAVTNKPTQLKLNVTIKKWGWPILIYKTLRERFELKWWQWIFYPQLCIKIMKGNKPHAD